jgi:flagellar hook-associated protein 2
MARLPQAGIALQKDGTLKVDSAALHAAMNNNFNDFTNLFSSTTGFATRFGNWTTTALTPNTGLVATHTASLNSSIQQYNDQIAKLELRMTIIQKQYTTTYTNLNMALSSMNATSSYLTAQFATK